MRIIVVDDDKIIRMGLIKILNKLFENHEIVGDFQNGLLAFEYLKENDGQVDLVITDIKMPIMTGIQFVEKANKELKHPPIFLVLSGYDEFTYVRDTMKYGAFNYLLKPIKKDELKKVVEEVEIKIEELKKKDKIMTKSIEVIKKDFFKHLLFSNSDINIRTDKSLLENIQLDEGYYYQMVVLPINKEEKEFNNKLLNSYFKEVSNNNKIEYIYFLYNDNVYIVFYFNGNEISNISDVTNLIDEKSNVFIENGISVFILEFTNKIWEVREHSKLVRKVKEKMLYNKNSKKYYVDDLNELSDILEDDKNLYSATSIKLAIQFITKNFNNNITLKDVADEVFLSQNYLSELFKKETGEGFYEFLSNYRVKRAKELLVTTNLKIYEVAESVGYNDSITFGRAFKKITGTTPNNFRNNKAREKSIAR
ncbi:response regulator transcription factor [uncultured Clostridium sp.]|uniref:response regulator transcription factor n=1 Tax=uncultured Clostridium sp. TaxID=59620 RepID=UPI00082139F9|nr:helix-turn-helix domain-containing protein [uncultured Clostridium sp.]SCJ87663.1 Bacillibactin transport regulator [uncultured Clostridium sp.]